METVVPDGTASATRAKVWPSPGAEVEDMTSGRHMVRDGMPQPRHEKIALIGSHHCDAPERIDLSKRFGQPIHRIDVGVGKGRRASRRSATASARRRCWSAACSSAAVSAGQSLSTSCTQSGGTPASVVTSMPRDGFHDIARRQIIERRDRAPAYQVESSWFCP